MGNHFRELLYGSPFEYQDKDNFLFILTHLAQYCDEMKITKLPMEKILNRLLDSSNVDIIVPLMMNFEGAISKALAVDVFSWPNHRHELGKNLRVASAPSGSESNRLIT